jgi:hypothetical protein
MGREVGILTCECDQMKRSVCVCVGRSDTDTAGSWRAVGLTGRGVSCHVKVGLIVEGKKSVGLIFVRVIYFLCAILDSQVVHVSMYDLARRWCAQINKHKLMVVVRLDLVTKLMERLWCGAWFLVKWTCFVYRFKVLPLPNLHTGVYIWSYTCCSLQSNSWSHSIATPFALKKNYNSRFPRNQIVSKFD